jgi:hypothetical protein
MPIKNDRIVVPDQRASEMKKFVLRKLGRGESGVDVELDDEQLNDSVADALLWWGSIVGWYRFAVVKISPGGGKFDVPNDCEEVVYVYFDDHQDRIVDVFSWAGVQSSSFGYGSTHGGYGGQSAGQQAYVVQLQSYHEQARKITSSDPNWAYDRDERKLHIYIRSDAFSSTIGQEVQIQYQVRYPDISKLHPYEYDLVKQYALAEAMQTLGNIRSKWIAVPTAQGEGSLNGDNLLNASEELKDKLTERARGLRFPLEIIQY